MGSIQLKYCMDCNKSFTNVERYEQTNLCIECFEKELKNGIHHDLIDIFSGSIEEVTYLKKQFEKQKIPAFILDEISGHLDPSRVSPAGLTPFRIMISERDKEKARQIIQDLTDQK